MQPFHCSDVTVSGKGSMPDTQSGSSQLILARKISEMSKCAWPSATGLSSMHASLGCDRFTMNSTLLCIAAGGLMILSNNFDVSSLQLESNSAFYGGAMFLSADLSVNASTSNLTFAGNNAEQGLILRTLSVTTLYTSCATIDGADAAVL